MSLGSSVLFPGDLPGSVAFRRLVLSAHFVWGNQSLCLCGYEALNLASTCPVWPGRGGAQHTRPEAMESPEPGRLFPSRNEGISGRGRWLKENPLGAEKLENTNAPHPRPIERKAEGKTEGRGFLGEEAGGPKTVRLGTTERMRVMSEGGRAEQVKGSHVQADFGDTRGITG